MSEVQEAGTPCELSTGLQFAQQLAAPELHQKRRAQDSAKAGCLKVTKEIKKNNVSGDQDV